MSKITKVRKMISMAFHDDEKQIPKPLVARVCRATYCVINGEEPTDATTNDELADSFLDWFGRAVKQEMFNVEDRLAQVEIKKAKKKEIDDLDFTKDSE